MGNIIGNSINICHDPFYFVQFILPLINNLFLKVSLFLDVDSEIMDSTYSIVVTQSSGSLMVNEDLLHFSSSKIFLDLVFSLTF
jgi:hypothetical protein